MEKVGGSGCSVVVKVTEKGINNKERITSSKIVINLERIAITPAKGKGMIWERSAVSEISAMPKLLLIMPSN